jgi:hypothetical protein
MAEEAMDASRTYATIGSADFTTSYQGPTPVARQTVSAPTMPRAGPPFSPPHRLCPRVRPLFSPPQRRRSVPALSRALGIYRPWLLALMRTSPAPNRVLDFRVDAATGLSIAMIRDAQTGAVVQQIPGADVIALAQMLADWSPGKHVMLDLIA